MKLKILLISLYFFGIGFSNPSLSFGPTAILVVKHIHEINIVNHHHHSEFDEHDDNAIDNESANTDHEKEPSPHSHELTFSMPVQYIIASLANYVCIDFQSKCEPIKFSKFIHPNDLYISAIFRPPIV